MIKSFIKIITKMRHDYFQRFLIVNNNNKKKKKITPATESESVRQVGRTTVFLLGDILDLTFHGNNFFYF